MFKEETIITVFDCTCWYVNQKFKYRGGRLYCPVHKWARVSFKVRLCVDCKKFIFYRPCAGKPLRCQPCALAKKREQSAKHVRGNLPKTPKKPGRPRKPHRVKYPMLEALTGIKISRQFPVGFTERDFSFFNEQGGYIHEEETSVL